MRVRPLVILLVLAFAGGPALLGAAQNAPQRPTKIKVTAEQANLREKPDIGSSIVQQIPEGTVLEADKKDGEWYFVRYTLEDGGVIGGWIHESLVEAVAEAGPAKPEEKTPAREAPPRERVSRPGRIGRIERPEFRTGAIPLEFAVSAGLGTLSPRDLNDGTRGYAGLTAASLGAPTPVSPDALRLAVLAGFELSYRFSPRLAFGLGADLLQGSNGDTMTISGELLSGTVTTKPSVRGVPVKIMVRFYPGAGIYIRGGLGLYSVKAGYLFRTEGAGSFQEAKGSATATGLGAEAAFGGEWDIAPRTAFFIEAGLRMASFSGLTGRNVTTSSGLDSQTEAGTLYFFHKTGADDNAYALVAVRGSVPSETGVVDSRRARVNLSGTAVRVGLRYRF